MVRFIGTYYKVEDSGRGSIQLNRVFAVINNLREHWHLSEGYGETPQEYNNRQSTIGLEVSFADK